MPETNCPTSTHLPFGGEDEPLIAAPLPDELEELRAEMEELRAELETHVEGGAEGTPGTGDGGIL